MASTIVVPTFDSVAVLTPSLAKAVIDLANAAALDIAALQSGGVAGSAPVRSVRAATTANLASLSSASVTQDGVTLVAGDRVLLKNQTTGSQNGIYVVGTVATGNAPLTRATDFDATGEPQSGNLVYVSEGTTLAKSLWSLTNTGTITVGSTALAFTPLNASLAPAGTDLTDAAVTITVVQGRRRTLPAATLSAARIVTLGTTGAVASDTILLTRLDATANTFTVANGGVGAGNLLVMPASKVNFGEFVFDGTNWSLLRCGTQ